MEGKPRPGGPGGPAGPAGPLEISMIQLNSLFTAIWASYGEMHSIMLFLTSKWIFNSPLIHVLVGV